MLDELSPVRDRVLHNARIAEGEVLLDVGAGDGLIAFGALSKVGQHGTVIFSDISQDLLQHCQALLGQMGLLDRCKFLRASADDLTALENASVDVVTTRSVLIYVAAKQQAFREFYRVLKPNGRLSIFEPINAVYGHMQPTETNPMLDFDDRVLVRLAQEVGFTEIHLELQVEVVPGAWHRTWNAFLRTAPNPCVPTLEEAMQAALTPDESERLTAYLRPLVETEHGTKRYAWAYLWAIKR